MSVRASGFTRLGFGLLLGLLALSAPGAAEPPLARLPGGTGELVEAEIASPSPCATGLAWDGEGLWVADRREDTLYLVDPASARVTATLPAPGFQPTGLAWDGEALWCADGEEGRLYRIDRRSGLVLRSVEAPWPNPAGLAWDGGRLWVADQKTKLLCQVDPQDGTTLISFPAPAEAPQGLAFDGRYLWCADRKEDRLYALDPRQGEVILSLCSPGPYPTGLAAAGEGELWVADYQTDRISRLRTRTPEPAVLLDKERHARITVTTDVLDYGPDGVETLEIYLAIPRELDNQRLLTEPHFTPEPSAVLLDRWGQPAAFFPFSGLAAGQGRRVRMEVEARVWRIRHLLYPDQVGPLEEVPAEIREAYLADSAKYDLAHPRIQAAVREAVGEEKNPWWIARRLYRYLVDHLEYELAGGWNAAPAVLARGNGSCSEYTFTYIALCRAAGLPARYAGSVVVRGDDASYDDVFHRWAEVWLPRRGWVPVDPSGGDKPSPAAQGSAFGELDDRFLITTLGGGDSQYLGWDYNGTQRWTSRGKAKLRVETVADWEPADPAGAVDSPAAKTTAEACRR